MKKEVFLFSVLLLGWTWMLQVVHTDEDQVASPAVNATHTSTEQGRRKETEEVCMLAPETGPCRAFVSRFFYNSTTKQCDIFVYGGCLGNRNNFKNRTQCMKSCYSERDEDEHTVANAESD